MKSWANKKRILTIATIATSLSIAMYFVGLFIVLNKINTIENIYNSAESESSKEKRFWDIKPIAETNKELIKTLRDFFVQKGDEVKFIEQIEGVAQASAIKFEIVSIDVLNQEGQFEENVKMRIELEGPWRNVMSFINKMEKMPFGVLIENINLDAKTSGNWSGFVEFIIFREK